MMERNIAIVLAAGQGKRMNTVQKKQYLLLNEKPILYYSLRSFENSSRITDIIIVVGRNEKKYVQEEIINKFNLQKVRAIVEGGKERYHSVYYGIQSAAEILETVEKKDNNNYIWIHDGARPFLSEEILVRAYKGVCDAKACAVGMPVKDTIKIANEAGYITTTPNRSLVWQIQTPQVFEFQLVQRAYSVLIEEEATLAERKLNVTDDAMVVETFTNQKVKLVEGEYKNIKITTPEDLQIAKVFSESKT